MNLDDLYVITSRALNGPHDYRSASPADILPRLGFSQCGDCGGFGNVRCGRCENDQDGLEDFPCHDPMPCPSCRRGWTPGDAVVEVMAKAISDSIRERGDVVEYVAVALARAAALALVDLLEGEI